MMADLALLGVLAFLAHLSQAPLAVDFRGASWQVQESESKQKEMVQSGLCLP